MAQRRLWLWPRKRHGHVELARQRTQAREFGRGPAAGIARCGGADQQQARPHAMQRGQLRHAGDGRVDAMTVHQVRHLQRHERSAVQAERRPRAQPHRP